MLYAVLRIASLLWEVLTYLLAEQKLNYNFFQKNQNCVFLSHRRSSRRPRTDAVRGGARGGPSAPGGAQAAADPG